MAWFDLKNATVKFVDGTEPTANEIEVKIGEGNFTYDETKARQYLLNRGLISDVRDGDQVPVDVSMTATWEFIAGDTEVTIEDALKQRNDAEDWISTDADPCNPYCLDIVVTYTPPCPDVKGEIITLADFRYEKISHDSKAGTFSISGKCNISEASVERFVQSSS